MGRTAVWGCAGIGGRRRVMWSAGDGKKAVKIMSAVGTRHLAFRCERVVYNVALYYGLGLDESRLHGPRRGSEHHPTTDHMQSPT